MLVFVFAPPSECAHRAIRVWADFTRRDDRFPFLCDREHGSTVHAILEQMDRFTGHDFYGSSLYGFILELGWILGLVKGNTCPGETKTPLLEKKLPTRGKRYIFSDKESWKYLALDIVLWFYEIYCGEPIFREKFPIFFKLLWILKRTIWIRFSKREIFTFTVLSFLHRVANKKVKILFFGKNWKNSIETVNKIFFVNWIHYRLVKNLLRFYFKLLNFKYSQKRHKKEILIYEIWKFQDSILIQKSNTYYNIIQI